MCLAACGMQVIKCRACAAFAGCLAACGMQVNPNHGSDLRLLCLAACGMQVCGDSFPDRASKPNKVKRWRGLPVQ